MNNVELIKNNPGLQHLSPERISLLTINGHPEKTTNRYKPTDDVSIVQTLNDKGWVISRYKQVNGRKSEDQAFKPYLATFENPDLPSFEGEGRFQILQRNAKDGTKAYEFLVGFFRFACENGLIVGDNLIPPVKVKHLGETPSQVITLIDSLTDKAEVLYGSLNKMRSRVLTTDEQFAFAQAAIIARVGDENKQAMKIEEVLTPRRPTDRGNSLWHTFNIVQENLIKAPVGVSMLTKDNKQRKARAITNIDQNLKVNQSLWNLAELFMQR